MSEVLESGHIYFFYRPRVEHEQARSLDDVQRFFFVLRPRGRRIWRLLAVGRKRLPQVKDGGERAWAFVDRVATTPTELEDELDRLIYETKTRGQRLQPEARPAGEGLYAIVNHVRHTHLAYELELPKRPGPVQDALNIETRASYIVAVRNPAAPAALPGFVPRHKAQLPRNLLERFRGRRFAALSSDFLDHDGVELVLIAATTQPQEELDELDLQLEPREERDTDAAIFNDLRLERTKHPLEPLFTGEWR